MAGDHAVAGHDLVFHPEVAAPVCHELVHFFERPGVEEEIDALARGELAAVVLAFLSVGAAAQFGAALEVG